MTRRLLPLLALAAALGACDGATPTAAHRSATATGSTVTLTWDAATDKTIESFHVYALSPDADEGDPVVVASATDAAKWKLVTEHSVTDDVFDAKAPKIEILPASNTVLKALVGKTACFRIAAYSKAGESPASNIACGDL